MNTEQGRQALRHFTVTRNWQPLQMALLKSILKKRVHIGLLVGCRHGMPPIRLI
nr:MAG TPA: hypothetical protein [Caudoviricetes sp.]